MSLRVQSRLTRRRSRRLSRSLSRRLARCLGGREPNHLAQAFAAYRRAARAHRKLIKLAPERFDVAGRQRLAREWAEEDRRDGELAVTIARVYGTSEGEVAAYLHRRRMDQRGGNRAETGRFSQGKKKAIEQWEAEWELWLTSGREAFDRHESRTPHRWLSLETIAQLLELSSVFGRLSTGLPLS